MSKSLYIVILSIILSASILLASPVYAWDPSLPTDPNASWNPPAEDGAAMMQAGVEAKSSSSSYSVPPPGTPPGIEETYFIDESGQSRTEFGDERYYLVVRANSPGVFYLAEYYPAGSGRQPHWLIYRHYIAHAGAWTFGPFSFEQSEPAGRHTWKLWLYNSGMWAYRITGFSYRPYYTEPPVTYPQPGVTVEFGNWSPLQVLIVAALAGSLGITIGILIAGRRRTYAG